MTDPISPKTPFANIDWSTLENRPGIDGDHLCDLNDYSTKTKCCSSGYTIEYVLDMATAYNQLDTPQAKILQKYPCINGGEIDSLVDELEAQVPDTPPPAWERDDNSLMEKGLARCKSFFNSLRNEFEVQCKRVKKALDLS
jgi:hypothetical protein